jgi:hypothetical protein
MNSESVHCYIVAGLTVRSEIPLPELIKQELSNGSPDVEIRLAPCPQQLHQSVATECEAEIGENEVLLTIPEIGRYYITNGRRILIDASPDVDLTNLRLFLLGSALGALFFQRGYFPLHASVVVINGEAVAFTGDSGAGKSTMAAWMSKQGYPILCDDTCVVRFDDKDGPVAFPGFPRLKLWKDTLNAFDINSGELQKDYYRPEKYHLTSPERFWMEPVKLKHINVLQFSETDSRPRIEDIKPAHAVHLLRNNTYRFQYISGLGLTRSHFLDCVKLARSTGVHYLVRPQQLSDLAGCQRLIEEQMK